jgi:hypothetical protein
LVAPGGYGQVMLRRPPSPSLHTHIYLYISVSVHTYMDVLDGLDNCSKDEERKQRNRQSGVSGHSAGWC